MNLCRTERKNVWSNFLINLCIQFLREKLQVFPEFPGLSQEEIPQEQLNENLRHFLKLFLEYSLEKKNEAISEKTPDGI